MGFKDKLVEIFKSGKKNTDNSYKDFAPMTGGNKFQTDLDLKVRHQQNIDTMQNKPLSNNGSEITSILNKMKELTKEFIDDYTLEPYWLLLIHSQYFTGMLKYYCSNKTLMGCIEQVKKCAFLYGKAAIFTFEEPTLHIRKTGAFYVHKLEKDVYGNVVYAELGSIQEAIEHKEMGYNPTNFIKVEGADLQYLHIFYWGASALSAWIWLWPFVNFQYLMNKMLVVQSISYNKKYVYCVSNMISALKEMKAYFDPTNPFIITIAGMDDLFNKFSTIEGTGGESARDFIQFYREYCDIWYQFIGRRSNVDFKKERSITNEIDASQDAIDCVQSDVLLQFDVFIDSLKNDPLLGYALEMETEKNKELYDGIIEDNSNEPLQGSGEGQNSTNL